MGLAAVERHLMVDGKPCTASAEDALVARARAGDASAFEQLYQKYAGRIYGLCVRLTRSPVVAEDVTQEVFVQAWRKLSDYRGESAFPSWLHRIAMNAVLGAQRAQRRRRRNADAARAEKKGDTGG